MEATGQTSELNMLGKGKFGSVYRRTHNCCCQIPEQGELRNYLLLAVIWHPHRKHPILWEVQMKC